jgi:hypothetical protein
MPLIKVNWNPSKKELIIFSLTALVASLILCAVLYARHGTSLGSCMVILMVGSAIGTSWLVSPKLARIIYCGFVGLTFPIGFALSYTLLFLFYYLLITPLALVFRLLGRDPLNRDFDRAAPSYWQARQHTVNKERYFQQF